MVKILFVHNAGAISGAEISLMQLISKLDTTRFQACVILPDQGPLYRKLQTMVPVYVVKMQRAKRSANPARIIRFLFTYIITVARLAKCIHRISPDIIHSNVTGAHLYAGPAGWLMRKPVAWHIRDLIPAGPLVRLLSFFSSSHICISNYVAAHAGILQHKKTRVIYNGTPVTGDNYTSAQEWKHTHGIPANALIVGQVGQLIPSKRHLDLVHIAGRIIPSFRDIRFVITGADLFGEYDEYIQLLWKEIDRRGLRDYFIFLGQVDAMDTIMEMTDILFHPSRSEPFGRVVIEAMAKGKPVIGIRSCGPGEIILHDQTGLLFEPGDLAGMEAGLTSLIRQPEKRASFGEAARRLARKYFTIEMHTRAIEKEYYLLTS